MRDNFYHWFAVSMLFAMFFGGELARAEIGRPNWFLIIAYGALGVMAGARAVGDFRRAKAGEDE